MLVEAILGLIAVTFIVLVIYVISLIKIVRVFLNHVSITIDESRDFIKESGGDTKKIIENTQLISSSLVKKVDSLDSIFQTISNAGDYLEKKSAYLKKNAYVFDNSDELEGTHFYTRKNKNFLELEKLSEIVELIGVGIKLWQKFKRG